MSTMEGVITAFDATDGIGRIRLASGEIVRVGATACRFPPKVGLRVIVGPLEPHALGGQRATHVTLADDTSIAQLLDESHPLRVDDLDWFVEETDGVGLLGVVVRAPMRTRVALQAWFARAGAVLALDDPRGPIVHPYRVHVCMQPIAGGAGVISFASLDPFSAATTREQVLASAELGHARVGRLHEMADLVALVRQLAEGEVAVIAHQARGFLVDAAAWIARSREPLDAWVRVTTSPGGDPMTSGMCALGLPDVFARAPVSSAAVREAALALVALGRRPHVGERLGALTVVSSDNEFVRIA